MVQAKKVRKGNEINHVVLAFGGLMNDMSIRPSVQVIGGIELIDILIVPRLVELYQWLQPHPPQVTEQLHHVQDRQLAKLKSVNGLHLNHWGLSLVDVAEIDQMMIEVKVERFPEPVLNLQILGLIIERLGTPTTNPSHMVMIINHQMRCVTSS